MARFRQVNGRCIRCRPHVDRVTAEPITDWPREDLIREEMWDKLLELLSIDPDLGYELNATNSILA